MKSVLLLSALSFTVAAKAQDGAEKPAEPEWLISFTRNKVIFECLNGCNYAMLMFDADRKVLLNENAMAKSEDRNNSRFLVQYSKKGNEIMLEGMKGVGWDTLSLAHNLHSKYRVTQTGNLIKTTF